MKSIGRHLLLVLLCLVLGYGAIDLTCRANARADLNPDRGGMGLEAPRGSTAMPLGSDEVVVQAEGPSQQPSYFNGVAYFSPLVIPAAAFRSDGIDPGSHYFNVYNGRLEGIPDGYGCVVAPAYLPMGVTVDSMVASVYDNDSTYDIEVYLSRVQVYNGTVDIMGLAESSGQRTSIETVSTAIDPEVALVQYPEYAYWVDICLHSDALRLYSVWIYFDREDAP